jgi:uncharacterized protein (DUF302 family)
MNGILWLPVIAMVLTSSILKFASQYDVATTIDRLQDMAGSKGLKIFARIDFAQDARDAGLQLRDEQLLIFGNPKAGTPLLDSAPMVGLDLPLKALAYQDADGKTWIVLNDPAYVISRHSVDSALVANIQGAVALVHAAAGDAAIEGQRP